MKTVENLKIKKKSKQEPYVWFLYLLGLLIYSPFVGISSMAGMVGDTAIQIKVGLDDMRLHRLITEEIYSWHPDLIWTSHEEGWYFLMGLAYRFLGIAGTVLIGCLFIYAVVFLALRYNRDRAHPLVTALVAVAVPFLGGFPDYNVRPSIVSTLFITLLILAFLEERKTLELGLLFVISSFIMAWLHGGILPVFFAVYIVLSLIELLYRAVKKCFVLLAFIPAGFLVSLLNPIGIRIWTFGFKQSAATDIWALVDEWQPKTFSIFEMFMILLIFVGIMTNDRLRKFEKTSVTKVALLCMFLIMTCVYKRFILYFSVAYLLFGPEEIGSLIKWAFENVSGKKDVKVELSDSFYRILAIFCLVATVGYGAFNIVSYFPTNSMADIERLAGYDHRVIEVLKEKGYSRLFNSFNTGSWLLFYDIPVHLDNRIDPYMIEFSPEDHIRGKMYVTSVEMMDDFREEYDNDAFLIETGTGYSELIEDIKEASDRYTIVYDNEMTSDLTDRIAVRWVIVECI